MAGPLNAAFTALSMEGHLPTWIAVRRRHNKGADALATHALGLAAAMRATGARRSIILGDGWPPQLVYPA